MTRGTPIAGPGVVPVATSALVTVTVAIGFSRVFDSTSFLAPLLVTAVVGHLVAATVRIFAPRWSAPVMLIAGALVTIDATQLAATTYGFPTRATSSTIAENLRISVDVLRHQTAPVAPDAGLLFVAAVALWTVAWSTDRLTFTYHAPIEALVPSATVFVIVTALAGPDHRWTAAALYGAAVGAHVLTVRHSTTMPRYGDAHPAPSPVVSWRPIQRGAALVAGALVVGLGAAATVPALSPEGLVAVRDKQSLTVVNPLLDIGAVLQDQSDNELFTVTADDARYWRLMTLDVFDGRRWKPGRYRIDEAHDTLARADTAVPDYRTVTAHFDLSGLGGSFAPTPFRASYLSQVLADDGDEVPMGWDPSAATLIARNHTDGIAGASYWVTAQAPMVTGATLATATGPVPRGIADAYTRLPRNFPSQLRTTAEQIVDTAGATTPYEKALALERWFRDPRNGFRYSTDPDESAAGDGSDAIGAFLESRRGFCVQFAGSFGALARAVGLPTRLVIGFTWGDAEPEPAADGSTTYVVRGRNAHSWPEVYFDGLGWLPFEPTPGRGNPTAESYTGIRADQDDTPTPSVPATTVQATPTTTADAAPATPSTTTAPAAPGSEGTPPRSEFPDTHPAGSHSGGLVGAALVAVLLAVGPLSRLTRRRMRRRRARTPAERVRLAWADTLRAWRPFDLVRTDVDTDRDVGDRLARLVAELLGTPGAARGAHRLAELAGAAAWHAPGVTPADATEATETADALERIARDHRPRWARLVAWFDPR